jgi:hypothetical protein
MSDAVIFAVIFVGFFILRLIAATVVFFFILPDGDRCPNCDAMVSHQLVLRMRMARTLAAGVHDPDEHGR